MRLRLPSVLAATVARELRPARLRRAAEKQAGTRPQEARPNEPYAATSAATLRHRSTATSPDAAQKLNERRVVELAASKAAVPLSPQPLPNEAGLMVARTPGLENFVLWSAVLRLLSVLQLRRAGQPDPPSTGHLPRRLHDAQQMQRGRARPQAPAPRTMSRSPQPAINVRVQRIAIEPLLSHDPMPWWMSARQEDRPPSPPVPPA